MRGFQSRNAFTTWLIFLPIVFGMVFIWSQPLRFTWEAPAAEPAAPVQTRIPRQVSTAALVPKLSGSKDSAEQLLVSTSFSPDQPLPIQEADEGLNLPLINKYPDLSSFVKNVSNGQIGKVRGVYAPGIFALPVIQQPKNKGTYVSNKRDYITQFAKAAENGTVGLLAHNYLSGALFYKLRPSQEVVVVFGDGSLHTYRITSIRQYQKLSPSDPHSRYLDLRSGQTFSSGQIFEEYYQRKHHLVFQTCLKSQRMLNWGLTFFTAELVTKRL